MRVGHTFNSHHDGEDMKHSNYLSLLLAASVLAGCATGSPRQQPAPVYDDNAAADRANTYPAPGKVTKRRTPAPIQDGNTVIVDDSQRNNNASNNNNSSIRIERPQTYRVQRGDTLYSIARKNNVSRQDIIDLNDLQPDDPLTPGQVLIFPVDDTPQPDVVANKPARTTTSKTKPRVNRTNVVRPDDNSDADTQDPPPARPVTPRRAAGSTACPNTADEDLQWVNPAEGELMGEFSETGNQKGLEITGDFGTPVVAAAPGEVVYSGAGLRGYGKLILIKHNATFITAYAHNRKLLVKLGQKVEGGEQIAEMGNTEANRVELYFELRKCGKAVDPRQYLPLN